MKHLALLALLAISMLALAGCRDPGPSAREVIGYNKQELSRWSELKQEWRSYVDTEKEKWPSW